MTLSSVIVIIQHPIKMYGLKGVTLAFRTKTTHFYRVDKARGASVRLQSCRKAAASEGAEY